MAAAQRFLGTPMAFAVSHPSSPIGALKAAQALDNLWVAADTDDLPLGFLFGEAVNGWFHILEISVASPGKGHGSALIEAVAAAATGLACDRLSLTTDREIAFNGPWYRRRGFVEIAATEAPDWLAEIPSREAETGLDPARRAIMMRRL